MKLFVRIAGIECQNCIDALTRALGAVEGVASVRFHGHVAELEIAQTTNGSPGGLAPPDVTARIVAAVRDEGYETRPEWISPPPPSPRTLSAPPSKPLPTTTGTASPSSERSPSSPPASPTPDPQTCSLAMKLLSILAAPAAIGPHSQGIAAILHNHSAVVRQ